MKQEEYVFRVGHDVGLAKSALSQVADDEMAEIDYTLLLDCPMPLKAFVIVLCPSGPKPAP